MGEDRTGQDKERCGRSKERFGNESNISESYQLYYVSVMKYP